MPVTLKWDENNCFIICTGTIVGKDVEEANYAFCLDERYSGAKYMIFDTSEADDVDVTPIDIMGFAAADSAMAKANPSLKVALVAKDPDILSKFETYLKSSKTFKDKWNTRIFKDLTDAIDWCKDVG